jgi:hypothetical protein
MGWSDFGYCGSAFGDANYTITKANDGYFFVQGMDLLAGGNMVLATGDQGLNHDMVFATGGFLAENEVMRFAHEANKMFVGGHAYGSGASIDLDVNGNANIRGNITSTNANLGNLTTSNYFSGNGSLLTSLAGANVTGQVGNALLSGTVYTNAQPNITSVGTLISVSVTGNVTGGNISTGGNLSVTGNTSVTGTLSSTGKIGYSSGSTVTQTTNRGNGVIINALAGTIITVSASMVTGEIGSFSVTNNQVDANNDIVLVQVVSPNLGNYNVIANPNSGISGFYVTLQNISGFPISAEAVTIRFMVIKAPNA